MQHTLSFECTPDQVRDILQDANGSIVSCIFRKRTGERELRKMVCRLGVSKGVTGAGMPYDPKAYDLIPVYDMRKHAFRMINLRTIMQLRYNGVLYIVQHPEVA